MMECGITVLIFFLLLTLSECKATLILGVMVGLPIGYGICIIIIMCLIMNYCLVLILLQMMTAYIQKDYERRVYEKHIQLHKVHEKEIEAKYDYIREIRHNLLNRIWSFYGYIESGETDILKQKIEEMDECLKSVGSDFYCCHPGINSILRVKIGKAKAHGIEVSKDISVSSGIVADMDDMGVIIGNLMDNAIEACDKIVEGKKYIYISIKAKKRMMTLYIENSRLAEEGCCLETVKEDKLNHGIGISSVRKLFDKYGGGVKFEGDEDVFKVTGYFNMEV